MQIRSHIERAIAILGSQTKLAAAVGCSQQQISYLLNAKTITAEMAAGIDRATGGAVAKWMLRPDVFDHPPANGPAAATAQGRNPENSTQPKAARRAAGSRGGAA